MSDLVTVCNRCGGRACWETGAATCVLDGLPRESSDIPAVKAERKEDWHPRTVAAQRKRNKGN